MLVPRPRDKSKTKTRKGEQIAPVDEGRSSLRSEPRTAHPCQAPVWHWTMAPAVISVCDDAAEDESGDAGQIEIGAVAPGDYT